MKKILLILFCFIIVKANATIWNVQVSNRQFTPATLNVVVGDVIHWVWVNGFHTTTSSSVPAGAAPWDAPIDNGTTTFDYTVTKAGSYSYFCQVHGVLVMSASFTATAAAPVTLSSFEIETMNEQPCVKWTTVTEINADYFSIRKSYDGINFNDIARVPAAGNSNTEKKYSFTDKKLTAATKFVYYSLATVDKDGRLQLSPIKLYRNKTAVPKLITSLSPNPISGGMAHLMLKFNADKPGIMLAKLIDMQGKIVLTTELSAEKGINNGHIHLGDISAGTYTIRFSLDGINESYTIIKK